MPTSNTSPIYNLARIGRLHLLREQFSDLYIPVAVETELRNIPDSEAREMVEEAKRSSWLKARPAVDTKLIIGS